MLRINKSTLQRAVSEIKKRVALEKPHKDAHFTSRYVGSVGHEKRKPDEQSRLRFLGFSAAQIDALAAESYSFSALPFDDQLSIWLELYHSSNVHEELIMALAWIGHAKRRELVLRKPSLVFGLQKSVDNWAVSDTVSSLIACLVEADPGKHLPRLKKWNSSRNPWDRRQSLVGLYCYASSRTQHLPARLSLPLVENLIEDPHYFIQKAVGWCLREIYQVDKEAQLRFVRKYAGRLSAAAFATATERCSAREKTSIKALRARSKMVSETRT